MCRSPGVVSHQPMDHRDPDSRSDAIKRADGAPRWGVADLIDLEYYLDADERALGEDPGARESLTARDRALYRDEIEPGLGSARPHAPEHRRLGILGWLRTRRAAEDPEQRDLLPGAAFARAQRLVTVALAVLGLVLGMIVASALLQYDGQRPVNVSWYIFLLVVVQFLLIAGVLMAWALRRTRVFGIAVRDVTILGRLIRPLLLRIGRWIQRARIDHATREARERALARQGQIKAQYALYGPISYLPVLVPAQVFGVAFNLGLIVTTVALEWFTDLAFGWGSALNIGPEAVHGLVRAVATPWGWLFGEGIGYPSLDQVAGSRINLKDPLFLLDAADLRSWRWFLVLAVLTYGLLPRALLLATSLLSQRRALARLPFTHARTQALYARMVTPRLETATTGSGKGAEMPIPAPVARRTTPPTDSNGADSTATPTPKPAIGAPARTPTPRPAPRAAPKLVPPSGPSAAGNQAETRSKPALELPTAVPASAPTPQQSDPVEGARGIAVDACMVLVHTDVDELMDDPARERLANLILMHTGWRIAGTRAFGTGSTAIGAAVDWVESQVWQDPPARMAVIMDGSQPPITESLRFLRELRAAAGTNAPLVLALVGDPEEEDPLPPVSTFDFGDWQRKITQLADPYLRLEVLSPPGTQGDT